MRRKGVFICIEGLDGSGKTTQALLLTKRLSQNHDTVYTAEPSYGKIGTFIRECCLYEEKRLPTTVEALLFAADRIEHLQNEVIPALGKGKVVICDRYVYSSLAYQGSAGVGLDWIRTINAQALQPDLAVLIDADPEKTFKRLNRKKSVMETLDTQKKVREFYLEFVDRGELVRIDGNKPKSVVANALYAKVSSFLKTLPIV